MDVSGYGLIHKFVESSKGTFEKKLSATDLKMESHFIKRPIHDCFGGDLKKGLKDFLLSHSPVISSIPSNIRNSIQSQILTVSGDILECSQLLLKTYSE